MKILIYDTEIVARAMERALALAGFKATAVFSADHARAALSAYPYPVLVLDVSREGGADLLRETPALSPTTRVIVLTEATDPDLIILALRGGPHALAHEFLRKPFNSDELVLAVTRTARVVAEGDFLIDLDRRSTKFRGVSFRLTPRELEIFHFMLLRPYMRVTYEQLARAVSSEPVGNDITQPLRTHMSRLRSKLRTVAGYDVIHSQRREGFTMRPLPDRELGLEYETGADAADASDRGYYT